MPFSLILKEPVANFELTRYTKHKVLQTLWELILQNQYLCKIVTNFPSYQIIFVLPADS